MSRYERIPTRRFRKDLRRLKRSGYDLKKLENAIDVLASGKELPASFQDHPLKGLLAGTRECHIGPDWLLRYCKNNDRLILILISTGTHRIVLGIE